MPPDVDPQVVDPPVEPVVAVDPAPAVDPPVDPQPEPQPEPPKHGNVGKTPWFLDRIAAETAKRQQAEAREAEKDRKLADANALLERLQTGDGKTTPPPPAQRTQAPDDRNAEIQRAAAQQRLYEDSLDVRNRGATEFGASWGETLNVLGALGATTNDEFVSDVLAVDKAGAHVILDKLAKDPERAVALLSMNSRQRIAELTRMTMAEATTEPKPEPKPVVPPKTASKAPAPAPPVQPGASKTVDWRSDDVTDAEFSRSWDENQKKRNARR